MTASRALGERPVSILLRRVLPNSLTPIVVAGTLGIGTAVLDVAALNFIGLGTPPTTPEWGSMIGLERNNIFSAPHLLLFPGIALDALRPGVQPPRRRDPRRARPKAEQMTMESTIIEDITPHVAESAGPPTGGAVLEVRGLRTSFYTGDGVVRAVTGVRYFAVGRGEIVALVGEAGAARA